MGGSFLACERESERGVSVDPNKSLRGRLFAETFSEGREKTNPSTSLCFVKGVHAMLYDRKNYLVIFKLHRIRGK